jgi:hypothetical protein
MTNAPITPGTQPQIVKRRTIKNEPQPLSTTASGGKNIANITLIKDIIQNFKFVFAGIKVQFYCSLYKKNSRIASFAITSKGIRSTPSLLHVTKKASAPQGADAFLFTRQKGWHTPEISKTLEKHLHII